MRASTSLSLLLLATGLLRAEVVDRLAAIVGTKIITTNDVSRQVRLTAFLNGAEPDYSVENRRKTAQMLVEQALIRREMTTTGLGGDLETNIDPQLLGLVQQRYPGDAVYKAALARYELTDADVKTQLLWQTQLVQFVDMRFRSPVAPVESELRDYYETTFVPEWSSRNQGKPPAFEDVREEVEAQFGSERANNALDRWLGQTRTQTRIRLMPEAFK